MLPSSWRLVCSPHPRRLSHPVAPSVQLSATSSTPSSEEAAETRHLPWGECRRTHVGETRAALVFYSPPVSGCLHRWCQGEQGRERAQEASVKAAGDGCNWVGGDCAIMHSIWQVPDDAMWVW